MRPGSGPSSSQPGVLLTPTPTPGEIEIPPLLPPRDPEQIQLLQAFGAQTLSAEPAAGSKDWEIAVSGAGESYPVAAYDPVNRRYLAVWTDDAVPGTLKGRLLGKTGLPSPDEILISTAGVGTPGRPELAYNTTDGTFMLLWSEPNGTVINQTYFSQAAYDLYLLRLDSDGNPVPPGPALVTDQLTFYDVRSAYHLAYNSAANEYLVVWEQPPGAVVGSIAHPHRVVAQRADAAGNLLGPQAVVIIGAVSSIRAAYSSGSDEYLVTWDRALSGTTSYELYAQRLSAASLSPLGSTIQLTQGNTFGFQTSVQLAYAPLTDEFLAVWEDTRPLLPGPYVPDIWGQRLEAGTGAFMGSNFPALTSAGAVFLGDVAYSPIEDEEVYQLAAQPETNQLTIRLIGLDGTLLTDPFLLSELASAFSRMVARTSGDERHLRWLVVWNSGGDIYARLPPNLQVYGGTVLTSAGTACEMQAIGQTQGYEAAPINTRTGGYDYAVEDLSIPTSAGPLAFRRSYASLAIGAEGQPLGFGWTHNHLARLIFPADPGGRPGVVLFQADSANLVEFIDNEEGTFAPAPGVCGTLTRDDGPPVTYTVTDEAQRSYTFDEAGALLSWQYAQGRSWSYSYNLSGRLSAVEDESGERSLEFDYDPDGNLQLVDDHTGRSVSFSYDLNGNLVSATDVLGQTWTYLYDAEHRMIEVIDPRGITVERTEYDTQGRAMRQFDGLGNPVVEIIYNPDGTTTVVDALNNSETHAYDYRKTLTGQSDAAGEFASKRYDLHFRPTTITDEDGDATELAWSFDGANLEQVIDAESGQTDLAYDALNNLTEAVDPRGFLTSYTYDGTLLTSSTDALGNTTSYSYTPEGFLASVTDPRGNTTSYTYDEFGQRTSMTDALLNTWTYDYDDLGRLVDTTDPFGRVTHNDYDAAGRLIRVTRNYDPGEEHNESDEINIVTEYAYNEAGNQVAVTDTYGRATTYEYDDTNRLVRTTDPAGNESANEYDEAGKLIATTDALGRITTYSYDELNRLVATADPLGNTTSTAYNPDGTVASTTDALGRTTSYQYDDLKRVVLVTDALGNDTTTTYDEAGNVVATTDALGRTTTFEYDALNRLIRQTDPLGGVTEHFYDASGNHVRTVDPRGDETVYSYDELNRLEEVTDALDNQTRYAYDVVGNRTAVTDANGGTTEFTYDPLDRLTQTQDPLGNTSETSYDALGNVDERVDANFNSTTFEYDLLNRLSVQWDARGGTTEFFYDPVGNQVQVIDANGHSTAAEYDAVNRPVYVTDANGSTTTTLYDEVGNVVAVIDPMGNYTNSAYDELNRQVSVSDPLGNTAGYGYDAVGNRTSMTDASGVVTRYENDDLNRLAAVVENYLPAQSPDHETNVRTDYGYDANGNRLTITDGSGHVTSFTYDDLNRLTSESDPLGHITEYDYDALGNRQSQTDAEGFTTFFTFDAANRLIGIDYPAADADVSFAYDGNGNRTFMQDGVGTTAWVYDELNRVLEVTDPFGGVVGYGYDAVGNRTLLTYPDGKQVSYAYDPADRMQNVTDWGLQDTSYSYDAADRLLTTTLPNGVVSTYSYDEAGRLLSIFHEAGAQLLSSFEYSYDPNGNRVQAVENMLLPETETPTPTPTDTPTATDTATATLTDTPTPTSTPTPSDTPSPSPTFTPSPTSTPGTVAQVSDFVLLGMEGVYVEQNAQVLSGDVGANVSSPGPYLAEGSEVTIGIGAELLDPASRVLGDSVYLKDNAQVYDVYYNELNGLGTVLGQHNTPVQLPLVSAFPDVPAFSPGTQDFDVPQGGSLTLDAGSYGLLKARLGSTVTFTGGVYDFSEWDVGENVQLLFEAPSEIRIAGKLAVEQGSYLGPAPGSSGLDARDIVIYVTGINGSSGNLGATPKAAKFGIGTTVQANVYVSNGTLWLRQNGTFTGAFLAKWMDLGIGATAEHLSQWSEGTGGSASTSSGQGQLAGLVGPRSITQPNAGTTSFASYSSAGSTGPASSLVFVPASQGLMTMTIIDYTYDPLQRLIAADYSTGEFFHYTYDAVGNRLTQDTLAGTNTYTYDTANRLIEVDGVPYTWDEKGNLLSDGASTYTYDHANRLASVTQGADTYTFSYNGLGDRVQQTVDTVPIDYTLDTQSGLTQALADGTNAYLYGFSRIGEEQPGGWQFHVGDWLRSVRQLTQAAGEVGLTRAYQPFGGTLSSSGIANSIYQFTGELRDESGLVYLRARYYEPSSGRFLTRDPFPPTSRTPATFNPYPYAFNNPIFYSDPSGRFPAAVILAVLARAGVGFVAGAITGVTVGGGYGLLTYEWALAGQCGCEIQRDAQAMTRWEWAGAHALAGGIIGGVAGAGATIAPIGTIIVGGAGVVVSVIDFVHTVEIIRTETGLTWCTGTRLLLDTAGAALGAAGIVQGVRAWRASGSLLRWSTSASVPIAGRMALDDLHAQSRPGQGWDVREVPGADPLEWFYKIADPSSIRPHPNPSLAAEGGLRGTIPGGGEIFYRPFTTSGNPAIDTFNAPGYQVNWKYHFPKR